MPAEWEPHEAVWLSWPHADGQSYPEKTLDWVMPEYSNFVRELTRWVPVYINVRHEADRKAAEKALPADRSTYSRGFRRGSSIPDENVGISYS